MSTRQLRRLQQQLELKEAAEAASGHDSSEDEHQKTRTTNFALLSALAGSSSDGGSDSEGEETAPQRGKATESQSRETSHGAACASSEAPTKKKRKSKKKKRTQADGAADDAGLDDVDRALREVELVAPVAPVTPAKSAPRKDAQKPKDVLSVNPALLKADEELKRIFGARAVSEAEAGSSGRGGRQLGRGRGRALGALRRGVLVQPKDHWPPVQPLLSMEVVKSGDSEATTKTFRFVHGPSYGALQSLYEECAQTADPNNIVMVLQQHAYHVDALLSLSYVHQAHGNAEEAEDMLEKAISYMELAAHPRFELVSATCRLPFKFEENRPFYQACFRYAMTLSRRGCHRTALEVSKAVLSLDRTDPVGMLQAIDYLAVRAREYEWLCTFVLRYASGTEGDGPDATVPMLPNMAFSVALAKWEGERLGGGAAGSGAPPTWPDGRGPLDSLTWAAAVHPRAVVALVAKLREKGACRGREWDELLAAPLFRKADFGGSASLEHLTRLFVERSHPLWRAEIAQAFLLRGAKAAAQAAGEAGEGVVEGITVADWRAVVGELFPADSANQFQHLNAEDFAEGQQVIPEEEGRPMEPVAPDAGPHGQGTMWGIIQALMPWYRGPGA